MATLLFETPMTETRSFAEELQASTAAIRLQVKWLGTRRSVTASQRHRAADVFDAQTQFVTMGKKLIDTKHPAYQRLVAVRYTIQNVWRNSTLPFPEQGIRLVKRRNLDVLMERMNELRDELHDAERDLNDCYDELRYAARNRLGRLYNDGDYPDSLIGMFDIFVDHPNVEPPEYLRHISPSLYRQESERIRNRFDEAVRLAEDAFLDELTKLVEHLTNRLSGTDDGKPKVFRDSVVTNLTEFFERFRRLNIGSNDELERLVFDARLILGNTTADDLRNSANLRQRVATDLSRVQS